MQKLKLSSPWWKKLLGCPSWWPITFGVTLPGYSSHSLKVGRWTLTLEHWKRGTGETYRSFSLILRRRGTV